jgi:hypothetical protein
MVVPVDFILSLKIMLKELAMAIISVMVKKNVC